MKVKHSPQAGTDLTFDALLEQRAISTLYQPIVSLENGQTVGYEALTRGPADTPFVMPDALFGQAVRTGRVIELDWLCGVTACSTALAAGLPPEVPLFVNVEPQTLGSTPPPELLDTVRANIDGLQLVIEITERSVGDDPATLLSAIARARSLSERIALDDVGANPASLVLLPLLGPDVIKFDRSVVQNPSSRWVSSVVNAVLAQAERTGAAVLAEGIETPEQLLIARAMGATLGQGWLFGHPAPLPQRFQPAEVMLPRIEASVTTAHTPFEVVQGRRPAIRTNKDMLDSLSLHLESMVLSSHEQAVLLAGFQDISHFGDGVRRRYSAISANGTFTAAFARGMPTEPAPGVRGTPLSSEDPLTGERVVVVIGHHFTGGLFAREVSGSDDGDQRQFESIITYDRDLVIEAARPLVRRLLPLRR